MSKTIDLSRYQFKVFEPDQYTLVAGLSQFAEKKKKKKKKKKQQQQQGEEEQNEEQYDSETQHCRAFCFKENSLSFF